MFDRIAGVYDLMNGVMTAGLHHRWRSRAADLARVGPGDRVLDVATGTGDLAVELASRVGPSGSVVGMDFSEAMLERAREKAPSLTFEPGDAQALTYDTDSFDAATVGFGARNFGDLSLGLSEMARVGEACGGQPLTFRRCRRSSRCGSTAWCRPSAASRATRTPTRTCRPR